MQIVIVGCGNVGATLTEQLSKEGHNITVIDEKSSVVTNISNSFDVMGVVGNGASFEVQSEAGVKDADLLIAVTTHDEVNLLCCLIARKAGNCHTIARVINPVYSREINYIKENLGISLVVNPQYNCASEIAKLLKFPSALSIDTFTKGRVELIKFKIGEDSELCNHSLKDLATKQHIGVLICVVERADEIVIPDGNFVLQAGDTITIAGTQQKNLAFFKKMGMATSSAKNVMIVGGGNTAEYLANQLIDSGVKVKIVERDKERCKQLSETLPEALVIRGDGTEKEMLLEEGLASVQAFVSLTNIDEENIMLALYAKSVSKAKLIARVHRVSFDDVINNLGIGSVIYPKYIMAATIVRFVRAMNNSAGSNIEMLYRMNENRVEAMEFIVKADCPLIGKPLYELPIRQGVLVCCITHKGSVTIASGSSTIQSGDSVIVVTTNSGYRDLEDILQ